MTFGKGLIQIYTVKFPYWGILNYAGSLCIKILPIFCIAYPNPNLSRTQYATVWKLLQIHNTVINRVLPKFWS